MTDSRCEPCRVIVYAPEESDALTRDRWKCARCGAPFEPAGQMQEELRATQAALDRLAKRYAEQETEIEMAEREYKDSEGNVVTLDKLVRIEPEWAANIIRWYEGKLETLTHELEQTVEALEAANSTCDRAADRMIELTKERDGYASKLDRYRSALERIIEAWDGDSESMHNDPAVIAREALSDE